MSYSNTLSFPKTKMKKDIGPFGKITKPSWEEALINRVVLI